MQKDRANLGISCNTCQYAHLCLAGSPTSEKEKDLLNDLLSKVLILNKGDHIYRENEKMSYLYAVKQGFCKDYCIDENGNEHIYNFYLPGDILSLDSLPYHKYTSSAIALSDAKLCMIPVDKFLDLLPTAPNLMKRFLHIMSYKMQNDRHVHKITNTKKRVAAFLINLLFRLEERKFPPNRITLPVSQFDMSNLLGMAYETVNRILHQFQSKEIIKISHKEIFVLDRKQLEDLASPYHVHGQVELV